MFSIFPNRYVQKNPKQNKKNIQHLHFHQKVEFSPHTDKLFNLDEENEVHHADAQTMTEIQEICAWCKGKQKSIRAKCKENKEKTK